MSCVLLVVVLFVALSPWRAISFIVPAVTNNNRWQEVFSLSHEVDCDACDGHTNSTGRSVCSAPVHTSRRKFIIQCTASAFTTSAAPFLLSSHAAAADTYSDTFPISPSSTIEKKNVIAVPLGPLAPFSTTRTYRNLELSNGLKVLLVRDKNALQSSAAISIDGAGQFSEPEEIPGLAHLMEHIVLSSSRKKGGTKVLQRKARRIWKDGSNKQRLEGGGDISGDSDEEDFEYWLEENDGDSNAFTAPGFVCFHFNVPHENLPEGLERFAQLFKLDEVENTIIDKPYVIPREIARVNDELDSTSDKSRAFYFLKQQINPEHPFSRFTAGSRETLQTIPMEKGIDVSMELLLFFRDHYLASRATLVVVSKEDVSALDRWISPFANVMSQKVNKYRDGPLLPYPLRSTSTYPLTQSIILRSKDDIQLDENIQVLCIEWPLSLQYTKVPTGGRQAPTQNIITSASVGFVLSQIISRRGPGSLRSFLEKFGWVPNGSTKGVPRITFPVDVTGFQILRMEIGLTLDGFANRSAVVAAVFESLRTVLSRPLQLDLIKQFLSAGLLHGYLFAPRPPDAVTLAVDALRFGIGGTSGVGNDDFNWYLMPSPEDDAGIERMRDAVTDTLRIMMDEGKAIISFRASPKAIFEYSGGIVDTKVKTLPLFSPWVREPITGARYLVESRAIGGFSYFKSLSWFAATFDGEELSPPYLNPLVPTNIRPARPVIEKRGSWGRRFFYLEDASASKDFTRSISRSGLKLTNEGIWRELKTNVPLEVDSNWKLWQIPPGYKDVVGIPLPLRPPEPTIECAFVFQLLSSLPAMFTTSQLALVNLWLLSFDDEILSLAELGAAAGIAYETSLNRSGLRICFRGVSQTLPSYVRRFCRRLVQHHGKLLDGTTKMAESVPSRASAIANRSPQMTRAEKDFVATYVTKVSEREVANEASFFLKCTSGAYLIAQGDILPRESLKLLSELQFIFRDYTKASNSFVVNPDLRDLTYKPVWKPKDSSPCLLPGVALISDACGRVPR